MNLRGSIVRLLKSGSNFYNDLSAAFGQNPIIRDVWLLLSRDLEEQSAGLGILSHKFWKNIKISRPDLTDSIHDCAPVKRKGKKHELVDLQGSIAQMLAFEEPVLLKIHAPLIRQLRTEWTNRAIDFYVIVKAHVAHLERLVQAYCGDPVLIRNAVRLHEAFEREVQEPEVLPVDRFAIPSRFRKRQIVKASRPRSRKPSSKRAARKPLASRRRAAAKPLVRKIGIRRRRARR